MANDLNPGNLCDCVLRLVDLGDGPEPRRIVGHAFRCVGHGWHECPAADEPGRPFRTLSRLMPGQTDDGLTNHWVSYCCCGGCTLADDSTQQTLF